MIDDTLRPTGRVGLGRARRTVGRTLAIGAVASMTLAAVVTSATPVDAVSYPLVALYQMNEGGGASVMGDSGPFDVDGDIGNRVETGVSFGGSTGYRFPPVSNPETDTPDHERLVIVPDNQLFDPQSSDFAIEFRYRTTRSFGNIVQKGQNTTLGGYFKFEQPAGYIACLFKHTPLNGGTPIQKGVNSTVKTNDGQWHTIRCELRRNFGVMLYVDGVEVAKNGWGTGPVIPWIDNDKNVSIGGKSSCDQVSVTCDYFDGDIDYIRFEKGNAVPPTPQPPVMSFTDSCDGTTCTFDAGGSNDPDGGALTGYTWDFGDGATGSGETVSHTFATPGSYTVSVTGTDNENQTGSTSRTVVVNAPPVMAFGVTCDVLDCDFDVSASTDDDGSIEIYTWDYGDGNGRDDDDPLTSHSYDAPGVYTVTLTGTDDDGDQSTTTLKITPGIVNQPPVMAFTPTCLQLTCEFDASASSDPDGTIESFTWDFGDGTTGTGERPVHAFQASGTYQVVLTGVDDIGASDTHTVAVTVDKAIGLPPLQGTTKFVPLPPARVFDTRSGEKAPGPKGVVGGGKTIEVDVTGVAGVPATGVSAVAINLTAVGLEAPGYVTAWPTGIDRPTASSLNIVSAAEVRANLVIVPVGDDGTISLFSLADAHLLGDIAGYYTAEPVATTSGRTIVRSPERLFDTRPNSSPGPKGTVEAGEVLTVQVAGKAGVPATGATAVVLNLTATEAAGAGFVTAWSSGTQPTASVINVNARGETAPNMVIVPLDSAGRIRLSASTDVELLADVLGYVTGSTAPLSTTGLFVPLSPDRVFDTRPTEPAPGPKGLVPAQGTITPEIAGAAGVPASAGAVLMNVTMVGTAPSYAALWPAGGTRPTASNVNVVAAGDVRPNGAMVALGDGGDVDAFVSSAAHLLADVAGYFLA